jgi:hypothetical protein
LRLEIARVLPEAIQQLEKVWTISNFECSESQSHATASRHVPHYTFGPDLAFRNKKVNLRYRIKRPRLSSLEKHATKAHILDFRGFGASVTVPIDPDSLSLEP